MHYVCEDVIEWCCTYMSSFIFYDWKIKEWCFWKFKLIDVNIKSNKITCWRIGVMVFHISDLVIIWLSTNFSRGTVTQIYKILCSVHVNQHTYYYCTMRNCSSFKNSLSYLSINVLSFHLNLTPGIIPHTKTSHSSIHCSKITSV